MKIAKNAGVVASNYIVTELCVLCRISGEQNRQMIEQNIQFIQNMLIQRSVFSSNYKISSFNCIFP